MLHNQKAGFPFSLAQSTHGNTPCPIRWCSTLKFCWYIELLSDTIIATASNSSQSHLPLHLRRPLHWLHILERLIRELQILLNGHRILNLSPNQRRRD